MERKDYYKISVSPTITDDTKAGLIVDAEFIKEFGGQFIKGIYYSEPKKEEIVNDKSN